MNTLANSKKRNSEDWLESPKRPRTDTLGPEKAEEKKLEMTDENGKIVVAAKLFAWLRSQEEVPLFPTIMKVNKEEAPINDKNPPRVMAKWSQLYDSSKWFHTQRELITDSPSRRDGISYLQELSWKQDGCDYIHHAVTVLYVIHEQYKTYFHQVLATTAYYFHRFYTIHSIKYFNVHHVATACLLIACKTCNDNRYFEHIVRILCGYRYSVQQLLKIEGDLYEMIKLLENIVLKTIGFNFNIALPHPFVLQMMHRIDQGKKTHVRLAKAAYFLASEVLLITDWSICYSPQSIAMVCLNVAAKARGESITELVSQEIASSWYQIYDTSMSFEQLEKMTNEILEHRQIVLGNLDDFEHSAFKTKMILPLADVCVFPVFPQVMGTSQVVPADSEVQTEKKESGDSTEEHQQKPVFSVPTLRRRNGRQNIFIPIRNSSESTNNQAIPQFKLGHDGELMPTGNSVELFGDNYCPA